MTHVSSRNTESDWLRGLVELALLFLMAVMFLRAFLMEGYLISTGSMAPGLLGLHKRVACPSCQYEFAFGVSFDDSVSNEQAIRLSRDFASCPNCGQSNIAVANVPANHGDQLLVHKGVFDFRSPRRWEPVVFRNPADPGEAYVKRVVALPGETIQVVNGDLSINGEIARKNLEMAREFRIPVFDSAFPANAADWRMPWQPIGDWTAEGGVLKCSKSGSYDGHDDGTTSANRLRLRNWRWSGGTHVVETPLADDEALQDWKTCVQKFQDRPVSWLTKLQFDDERRVLSLHGVLPQEMQDQLIADATSESFRRAVYRLAALSHLSPVTDRYGYNSTVGMGEFPVSDLFVEFQLEWQTTAPVIEVAVPVENRVLRLRVDVGKSVASLSEDGIDRVLSQESGVAELTAAERSKTLRVEVTNFDHRVVCAVNGAQILEPIDLPLNTSENNRGDGFDVVERARQTAKFVNQQSQWEIQLDGQCTVGSLKLFRDVYYTPGRGRNAIEAPLKVAADSYFVQGDNSPVSSDSRNWEQPCVPHNLLIGKPFVVHLPSRPGKLSVGGWELPIRIPDFQRIRYIR